MIPFDVNPAAMWPVALGRTVVFVARRAAAACLRKSREWGGAVVNGIVACRRRVVTVTEVVPANGPTARTNRVTVSGTNFDPNPTVTFGADLGGNVSRQDAQTILVDVPRRNAGAGAVAVTVTNTDGSSGSLPLGYTYAAPVVRAIQPNHGPRTAETAVTIMGSHFVNGATVQFGAVAPVASSFQDAQTITANAPVAAAATAVDVTVISTDGARGVLQEGFTYDPPPTIAYVRPDAGTTGGTTTVVIQGQNFRADATVTIDRTPATVTQIQPNAITVTTPQHGRGANDVVVTNSDLQTATANEAFHFRDPIVTSITPSISPLAGTAHATITGDFFGPAVTVTIAGAPAANVARVSEQTVTADIPACRITTVQQTVIVTNTHDGRSGGSQLVSYEAMRVDAHQPNVGLWNAQTPVVITGHGFDANVAVTFGGQAATALTIQSSTQITATTPALPHPGTVAVDVVVTNGDGQAQTLADEYTYLAGRTPAVVVPPVGANTGGNRVRIFGHNFTNPSEVQIGGQQAEAVNLVSANELTATVPALAAANAAGQQADVHVQSDGVAESLANGYSYAPAPPRKNVVIYPNGHDFATIRAQAGNTPSVEAALHKLHNQGELDDEHVSAPNQRCGCAYHRHLIGGTGGLLFVRLQDAPHRVHQIIDVTLGRGGPTHNNYRCNLIGPIAGYHFWHAERSWTVQRKQQHTAAQQLLFAGDVAIQNAVTNAFRITGVTPPRGPQAGGWPVTITGENIPQNVDVLFGGVNAANVVRLNATTVTATVPAGAALGAVHVRVQEQVTLIYSEIQNGFTYEAFALTSLCRCIGSDTGGESVVIVGTGFEHGATVTIPGAAPVATQVIAPNCIVIVSMPPHVQGNVNVNVTNPSGATQFYAYDYV